MLHALLLLVFAVVGGCALVVAKFGWIGLLLTPVVVYAAFRVVGLVSPALFGHWVYAGLEKATRPMAGAKINVNDIRPTAARWASWEAKQRAEFREELAGRSETPQRLGETQDQREPYAWRTFDLTIAPAAGDDVEWEPDLIGLYSSPGPGVQTAADAFHRLCEVTRHEVCADGKWEDAGNRTFRGELRVRMTAAVPNSCHRYGLIYALTMLVSDFEASCSEIGQA